MLLLVARPSLSAIATAMREIVHYTVTEVEPYVNWLYFYHAWQMGGKPETDRESLRRDADAMLHEWGTRYSYHTHAVVGLFDANSEGDDLIINGTRMPMLRQQQPDAQTGVCLCLADFVRPSSKGVADRVGVFAATVDYMMETSYHDDPYLRLLAQTLADRLAEATAERLHEQVRRQLWGYASDEHLTMKELHDEAFQGIRPAVGYPSLPDTSLNFLIEQFIAMSEIGIRLTENGAMRPHASVSGLMLAHPQARYFPLGKIGPDQLADYASRRGIPVEMARKFLASSIINTTQP